MKERLFTRDFALCTLCCFFYTLMFFLFFSGISSYAMDNLGCSSTIAGFVTSSFIIGDLVARIVLGRRMDSIGKRLVGIVSASVCIPLCLCYLVVGSVTELVLVRLLQGFAYGGLASAVATMVTERLPDSRRGEGIGYFYIAVTLGSAIGPFGCMWLQGHVSADIVFVTGTATVVLALVCLLFVREVRPVGTRILSGGMHTKVPFLEMTAIPISIICFVFYFSYSGVLSFMEPFGASIGMVDEASVFFVFISCSTLISRLFLCRIIDTHGDNVALVPFFILFIIGMLMMSMADNAVMLLGAGFLMGFNVAQFVAVGQAASVRNIPKERYGSAVSTFSAALDLSYAVGPMFNGFLIAEIGYRGNYAVMAGIALFALLLYWFIHGRRFAADRKASL